MDIIQIAFLPVATFWIAFKTLMDASVFSNNMRETIITGIYNNREISLYHRQCIFFDWCLTIIGTITASFVFSGLIFWISIYISHDPRTIKASLPVMSIGFITLIGGIFFIVCGISDFNIILHSLQQNSDSELKNQSGASKIWGMRRKSQKTDDQSEY